MLRRISSRKTSRSFCRHLRSYSCGSEETFNVVIINAAGQLGRYLTNALKTNELIKELRIFDKDKSVCGIASDANDIPIGPRVKSFPGVDSLKKCLLGADVIAICAGLVRKPGQKREEVFDINAQVIQNVMPQIGRIAPFAINVIMANPINSLVPMAAVYLNKEGSFDPNRLLGATGIDEIRAKALLSRFLDISASGIKIPVFGGHSDETILPLLSKMEPSTEFDEVEARHMLLNLRNAGDVVLNAADAPAYLAPGWANACLLNSILEAKSGKEDVSVTAFVRSDITDADYFSSTLVLGKCGIKNICPLPCMNDCETSLLKRLMPVLKKDIEKGCEHANSNPAKSDFCTEKKPCATKAAKPGQNDKKCQVPKNNKKTPPKK